MNVRGALGVVSQPLESFCWEWVHGKDFPEAPCVADTGRTLLQTSLMEALVVFNEQNRRQSRAHERRGGSGSNQ